MQAQVQIMPYQPNRSKYNIEFKKYADWGLSKDLQNLLRFSFRKNNFFVGKKNRSGNHLSGYQW